MKVLIVRVPSPSPSPLLRRHRYTLESRDPAAITASVPYREGCRRWTQSRPPTEPGDDTGHKSLECSKQGGELSGQVTLLQVLKIRPINETFARQDCYFELPLLFMTT